MTEKLVCSSPDLAVLDLVLSSVYRDAVAKSSTNERNFLRKQQNKWLRQIREKCENIDCLKRVYEARIDDLKGLR